MLISIKIKDVRFLIYNKEELKILDYIFNIYNLISKEYNKSIYIVD